MKYLNVLLILAPVAILGRILGWSPTLVFLTSALAVIPTGGLKNGVQRFNRTQAGVEGAQLLALYAILALAFFFLRVPSFH